MDQTKTKGKNINGDLEAKRLKARENLAKARAIRMKKLKQKKQQTFDKIDSDSDYSIDSELIAQIVNLSH